jgi:hypothetical protein
LPALAPSTSNTRIGLISAEEEATKRIVLQRLVNTSLFMLLSPIATTKSGTDN